MSGEPEDIWFRTQPIHLRKNQLVSFHLYSFHLFTYLFIHFVNIVFILFINTYRLQVRNFLSYIE